VSTNGKYQYETNENVQDFPKVSIIVATYRREESLGRALLSLITQTYSDIEIIVVDDNADSVWNSKVKDIIETIKHERNTDIIYIKNKYNKGSAETRNVGIAKSTGEYITFLDDDDVYLPDKVMKQVNHMIANDLDYSLTDLWLYDKKDKLIEKRVRNYIKDYSVDNLRKYHLMYHMTGTDVIMFRKKYLFDIGMFPPINVGDEFYLMHNAIEEDGKFGYLPECDVKAYVHIDTDGLSSGEGKIKGENELYEYKKKYFKKLTVKEIKYINMRHYAVIAFAELRRRNVLAFMYYSFRSFIASPFNSIKLFLTIQFSSN
jgi:glycosyltransferase involved in cell wall biosynthesis